MGGQCVFSVGSFAAKNNRGNAAPSMRGHDDSVALLLGSCIDNRPVDPNAAAVARKRYGSLRRK
jgi:hypothetical protein